MIEFDFAYLNQPSKKYTFEQPKLRTWVESWCIGVVLNLFAGKTKLDVNEYRVDINQDMVADWYGSASDFLGQNEIIFDTIIFDPPYNLRKAYEKYNGHYMSHVTAIREGMSNTVRVGGRVISFGYDSTGMSRQRGYQKIAICLVNHKGFHNDTICVVEEKIQMELF